MQGRELEKEHGKMNLWNGDSSRLHVRKAQYKCVWVLASPSPRRSPSRIVAMDGTGAQS
jgi:hypothetical protein